MYEKDYYKILNVAQTATKDEIKDAFRQLAKKYHPDISTEKNAELKFREISEAYEILSDDNKRSQYDQLNFVEEYQVDYASEGQIFNSGYLLKKIPKKVKKGPLLTGKVKAKLTSLLFNSVISFNLFIEENCTSCSGKGYVIFNKKKYLCDNCQGLARFEVEKTVQFNVTNFKETKQTIVLKEQGSDGYNGGPKGDIKLKLILKRNKG
ncbi:curved DNA-binding protein [Spiroplasma syrphidicola EA-1]|uniref:Curved DNA-binding protein n=1 Tax=Spiroplasma syrphidicola EA-1 TaxID=1276229 RepID=R4U6H1_9MOLU|nr:DnaJ domain-containing protein [Spiroplasma syrphidicola]AGM26198.1 curved DNA-binding protein [Spiroplasma syrphidicola EA-1]